MLRRLASAAVIAAMSATLTPALSYASTDGQPSAATPAPGAVNTDPSGSIVAPLLNNHVDQWCGGTGTDG